MRLGGHTLESRDYWLDNSQDINILEAQALLYSLLSFRKHLNSSRVDVYTDNRVLKSRWRMEAAGAPKLTAFLKTFFVPTGKTILVLMFTTFRQVKIRLTSLPEADRIRIVCCQIALGSESNAFSGPTRSISCPWIVTANAIG